MVIKHLYMAVIVSMTMASCTWVKMTPEGEKVRVLSLEEVSSCKKLGKVHATLKDEVAGVERNREKVKTEMETLARNHAGTVDGDTVVAVSEIVDGKQTFDIYRCVNP